MSQRFTINSHAFLTRAANGFMRLLTADVHNVKWNARGISDCNGAVCRFTLKFGRSRIGMTFGASDPLSQHLLLHISNQISIFRVHHRQRANFFTALEAGEHFIVFNHQSAFIGHEMLERINPHIHSIFHAVKDIFAPAGDRHVIAHVRANLRRRLSVPFIDRIFERAIFARQTKINHHRGAAHGRCPSACFEGFSRCCAHKRHFEMGVWVNAPRNDISTFSVNIFVAFKVLSDLFDHFAFN